MASHFQELNTNRIVHLFRHNSRLTITYIEVLDEDIFELRGVQCAIQRLKTNKSPGLDGLYPELFKLFNNNMVQAITRIFNSVYNSGIFPTPWCIGCIKPIYKKGDELLPSNYRGITLLPIMANLFTSILNRNGQSPIKRSMTHNLVSKRIEEPLMHSSLFTQYPYLQ